MQNDDYPLNKEGFYCVVDYKKNQEAADMFGIHVTDLESYNMAGDFLGAGLASDWNLMPPNEWCKDENDCRRGIQHWTDVFINRETYFPFDNQNDEKSAVTCSVWRPAKIGLILYKG